MVNARLLAMSPSLRGLGGGFPIFLVFVNFTFRAFFRFPPPTPASGGHIPGLY